MKIRYTTKKIIPLTQNLAKVGMEVIVIKTGRLKIEANDLTGMLVSPMIIKEVNSGWVVIQGHGHSIGHFGIVAKKE